MRVEEDCTSHRGARKDGKMLMLVLVLVLVLVPVLVLVVLVLGVVVVVAACACLEGGERDEADLRVPAFQSI